MLDHYNYKKLYKCTCVLCRKCRTVQVRHPETKEDEEISKRWKMRRIIFNELSYLLKNNQDDVKIIWSVLVEKEKWNPLWYKTPLRDIFQELKDIYVSESNPL